MLKTKLDSLNEAIDAACARAGRKASNLRLLLATKTIGPQRLKEVADCGYTYFGENRAQELLEKQKALIDRSIVWDFIGHLQSNKVKDVLTNVDLIHSLDRKSLLKAIEKHSPKNYKQKVLIEINTSLEVSKAGLLEQNFSLFLEQVLSCKNIEFKGLMTIAKNTKNESEVRACFKKLYDLRKKASSLSGIKEENLELSMGMSNDYMWAIEEGSTIIRLGSAVFGART